MLDVDTLLFNLSFAQFPGTPLWILFAMGIYRALEQRVSQVHTHESNVQVLVSPPIKSAVLRAIQSA